MDTLSLVVRPFSLLRIPCSVAMGSSRCKGSMAKMKSDGDSGSPLHKPLPCCIGWRGVPLRRTRDVDEVSKAQSIFAIWGGGGVVAVQVGSPKRPSQKLWLCLTSKAVLVFWFYKNIVRGCVWDGSCHKCFGLWWMHSGWATLTRSWMEWGATLALLWWFFAAAWIRLMGQQSQMSCPILFWEKHDVCLVKQV